jgi:hypothetical protein
MWSQIELGPLPGVNAALISLLGTGFSDVSQGTPLQNFQSAVADSSAYYDTGMDLSTAWTDYGIEIVWGQSVTWFWNTIGGSRQQVRQVQAGIPTSGEGETLVIKLAVVNGQSGSSSWHTVWNGKDSDSFDVAAIQAYAR